MSFLINPKVPLPSVKQVTAPTIITQQTEITNPATVHPKGCKTCGNNKALRTDVKAVFQENQAFGNTGTMVTSASTTTLNASLQPQTFLSGISNNAFYGIVIGVGIAMLILMLFFSLYVAKDSPNVEKVYIAKSRQIK